MALDAVACPWAVKPQHDLRHLKAQNAVSDELTRAGRAWRHRLRGNGQTVGRCRASSPSASSLRRGSEAVAHIFSEHWRSAGASTFSALHPCSVMVMMRVTVVVWRGDGRMAVLQIPPEEEAAYQQARWLWLAHNLIKRFSGSRCIFLKINWNCMTKSYSRT